MEQVFLRVLNMSISAGYVILAVLLARLLLRRAPKKYSYALWLVVAFRLCCPPHRWPSPDHFRTCIISSSCEHANILLYWHQMS